MIKRAVIAALLAAGGAEAATADDLAWLDAYNVVWRSQSKNSGESMPCGGGDIGLNVWVEDGELLFYVGQAGCRDENGALLKHGRVRLSLSPNPFAQGGAFRQELKLRQGCVEVQGNSEQAGEATVRLWVEVHRPVVHMDIEAGKPLAATATFETWRTHDIFLDQGRNKHRQAGMAMMNRDGFPGKVWLYRDTIEPGPRRVTWFHRMRNDKGVFEYSVRQQGLESGRDELYDLLTDLTCGGALAGEGLKAHGTTEGEYAETPFKGWRYQSQAPARRHRIKVFCHVAQTPTVDDWKQGLEERVSAESPSHQQAWERTLAWWRQFWSRSRIVINSDEPDPEDKAWQVGRNYNLFRYQLACNLSGREPTLFNGGLFTYDPGYVTGDRKGEGWTPDWRRWGAGLTAQNQRLLYWPMLRSGDFDVIAPGLDFYRLGLASSAARVKVYWGHEGCCCAEQISVLGLPGCAMWGFSEGGRRGRPESVEHGVQVNGATHYLYQAQLEFAYMMLQWHRYSGRDIRPYLPFIDAAARFYDQHYRMRKKQRDGRELDENGHIVIKPSKACEDYGGAVNPADATAGLHAVLNGLLDLDDGLVPPEKKAEYEEMLSRVPPVPTAEMDGDEVIAPAANLKTRRAREMPELYPVFPYNRFGLGREGLEVARQTWKHTGGRKRHVSWEHPNIFAARLGLTDEAVRLILPKLGDSGRRFPTFWGPGYDWVPDHNWGGSGMIGLQEMLVQSHGRKIWLLPAWPKDWAADFKLHAPYQTVVEDTVRDGKLVRWSVMPKERRGDVTVVGPQ